MAYLFSSALDHNSLMELHADGFMKDEVIAVSQNNPITYIFFTDYSMLVRDKENKTVEILMPITIMQILMEQYPFTYDSISRLSEHELEKPH